jgi:hypothetical protein
MIRNWMMYEGNGMRGLSIRKIFPSTATITKNIDLLLFALHLSNFRMFHLELLFKGATTMSGGSVLSHIA